MNSAALENHATASHTFISPQRVAVVRAVAALVWAVALGLAVRDRVPHADSELPVFAALVLTSYPLIDVSASLISARSGDARALRVNAAISALGVIGLAVAGFGSDAGAVLLAFGAWAAVSGAIQLGIALRRLRTHGRQLPMIVSGGLSTIAGIGFAAKSGSEDVNLTTLAGYMTFGALLFLLWAGRNRTSTAPATSV